MVNAISSPEVAGTEAMELPADFTFGAAMAAFQIEGAWDQDGKGPSVWDDFTHRRKKIRNNDLAETACNHYYKYREDVALMKDLDLDAYRFSISWPRIYPEGKGAVNQAGLDFYSRLTDTLLEKDITPFATLFHWDLPLALQKQYRGFENRDVTDYFAEYCETVVSALGDRVKNWITVNEPWEYACLGHFTGYHAPGRKSLRAYFRVMHNLLLAHGKGMRVIKSLVPDSNAGITISMTPVHPATDSRKDQWSAMIANQFINHITLSPLYKKEYPRELFKRLRFFTPRIEEGDMDIISHPADFVGLNLYSREFAMYKWYIPFLNTWVTGGDAPDAEYEKDGRQYSSIGWEVYPDAMYESLKIIQDDYGNPPVIITENGAPFTDTLENGRVHDPKRIDYLRRYLLKVSEACKEGADVRGYFVWSFLDNFEWSEGFDKRFGIVHVNYETQERTIKDSGFWYRDLIQTHRAKSRG